MFPTRHVSDHRIGCRSTCGGLSYLYVRITEGCDAGDLGSTDTRRFQLQHRLENSIELCYAGRHDCGVDEKVTVYSRAV